METWIKDTFKKSGAYLLGVVILVVVWRLIAQPMLDRQDQQRAEDRKEMSAAKAELAAATKALAATLTTMERIQNSLDSTARIQERVVDKLLQLDRR